ncbi:MAG TPA: hypothetical protein EYP11_02600, partial [Aquificaceae bacterium]|nr:hypothetical protein [Aquificaceae bacterium]
ESETLRDIIHKTCEVFERWGYDYVKPPVFDHLEAHSKALGSRAEELIAFKDLSQGSFVALRADFTAQVVRSVSFLKPSSFPVRVYYFGTVFSAGGRTYEKFHTGIELIGVPGVEGDGEVIAVVFSLLRDLGLGDLTVSIGHVGIVENILKSIGEERREALRKAFMEKNLTLLEDLLGGGPVSRFPLLQGGAEVLGFLEELGLERERRELEKLGRFLAAEGVSFMYDLSEVRELPYYTGIVFEVFAGDLGSPVAGGGRYDKLSGIYGGDFPATGGTVYGDNLLELLGPVERHKDFFVIDASGEEGLGFKLASALREKGYRTGVELLSRSSEESINYAFGEGYRKAVLLVKDGVVRIYSSPNRYESLGIEEFLELV